MYTKFLIQNKEGKFLKNFNNNQFEFTDDPFDAKIFNTKEEIKVLLKCNLINPTIAFNCSIVQAELIIK